MPIRVWAQPARSEDVSRTRQVLDDILRQSEFQNARRNAQWLHWLRDHIMKAIASLLRHLHLYHGHSDGMFSFVDMFGALLMSVLIVGLALLLVRTLRRRGPRTADENHEADDIGLMQRLETASEWLRLAETRAASGDYHHAMRSVYVATLRRLEEQGAVRFERGQTNWELVRQLRGTWRYEPLSEATRLFDTHWYGVRPASAAEYEKLRGIYQQFDSAAARPS
jgi:hypothetical protein